MPSIRPQSHRTAIAVRLKRLRSQLREVRAAAVLLTDPIDVGYFSGFTGEDSYLLVAGRSSVLLTDGRFTEQAGDECPCATVFTRKKAQKMGEAIAAVAKRRRLEHVVYVPASITVAIQKSLAKSLRAAKVRFTAAKADPALLRQVKDDSEIAAIRRAVRCAEAAWKITTAWMTPGMTERQVAAKLDYEMMRRGASGPAFETIVAAGPRSSLPHARPTDRRIRRRDMVLFDWGALVDSYRSDLTRVVFIGTVPPRFSTVYALVLAAQQAGIAALSAGKTGREVDAAARKVIADGGYGERFVHSLGHGLGRMTHERPVLGTTAKAVLEAGMVVTVEPGIYLPGAGGIRIEDDCLVTDSGRRVLSSLPKDLERMRLS